MRERRKGGVKKENMLGKKEVKGTFGYYLPLLTLCPPLYCFFHHNENKSWLIDCWDSISRSHYDAFLYPFTKTEINIASVSYQLQIPIVCSVFTFYSKEKGKLEMCCYIKIIIQVECMYITDTAQYSCMIARYTEYLLSSNTCFLSFYLAGNMLCLYSSPWLQPQWWPQMWWVTQLFFMGHS